MLQSEGQTGDRFRILYGQQHRGDCWFRGFKTGRILNGKVFDGIEYLFIVQFDEPRSVTVSLAASQMELIPG